jgi:hypothetical protein
VGQQDQAWISSLHHCNTHIMTTTEKVVGIIMVVVYTTTMIYVFQQLGTGYDIFSEVFTVIWLMIGTMGSILIAKF